MSDVLHRATKAFLKSVSTPRYPVEEWIINPDMAPVDGVDKKYWKIAGDIVSAMDQAEQDAVDAAEQALLDAETLRLQRYLPDGNIPPGQDHTTVDYTSGLTERLHKEVVTMFRGEVRCVKYYDMDSVEANPDNPENWELVLTVDISYARDAMGLASSRETVRTWLLEDGSSHVAKKTTKKKYTSFYSMVEGTKRRQNIVDFLALQILGLLAYTETSGDVVAAELLGRAFTFGYDQEINNFIRVGSNEMTDAVTADTTTAWLDNDLAPLGFPPGTTIRTFILEEIKNTEDPPAPWHQV